MNAVLFAAVCIGIGLLVVATLKPDRLTEPTHATFARGNVPGGEQ